MKLVLSTCSMDKLSRSSTGVISNPKRWMASAAAPTTTQTTRRITQSRFRMTFVRSLREKDPSSSETLVQAADAWGPFDGVTVLYKVPPLWQSYKLACWRSSVNSEFSCCASILPSVLRYCDSESGNNKLCRMAHAPDGDRLYSLSR